MQGGEVVGVVFWVSGVGNHSYNCAFQRSPSQQPLADQVHVPRRVDAKPDGGAREEHSFMGQQKRETTRYLYSAAGGHYRCFLEASSPFIQLLLQTNMYSHYLSGHPNVHIRLPGINFKIELSLTTRAHN